MVFTYSDFSISATYSMYQGMVIVYFAQNFIYSCIPYQKNRITIATLFR